MRSSISGLLVAGFVLGWTGHFPLQGAITHAFFIPEDQQPREYRLALKPPGGEGPGAAEEMPSPGARVPQQPVAPEKPGPTPSRVYKPSEQIPADQAVDFPSDI
jgi:hypothetical protein